MCCKLQHAWNVSPPHVKLTSRFSLAATNHYAIQRNPPSAHAIPGWATLKAACSMPVLSYKIITVGTGRLLDALCRFHHFPAFWLLTAHVWTVSWRVLYARCELPRPISTRDPEYTLTAIILFIIQTLVFIPRVATRLVGLGKWYRDDTACVTAYVSVIVVLRTRMIDGSQRC